MGQTTSAPRTDSITLLTASAKDRASKKGKYVAVSVQPFLPLSSLQGHPELEVASLHSIALLVFTFIFFHFSGPSLNRGKEVLSLNACWVKKCLLLRPPFKTFSLIAIESCGGHRTKYMSQDLVPEMLLSSKSSPCLPQNGAQSPAARWVSLCYSQLCLLQALVLSIIYSFHLMIEKFHQKGSLSVVTTFGIL